MQCIKCGKMVRGRPSPSGVCPACRAGKVDAVPAGDAVPGAEAVGPSAAEPHCYPASGVAINPAVQ